MSDSFKANYLDGLPDLPDKPMTLKELASFYDSYQDELLERFQPGTKEASLRTNRQKRLKEGWHAYFFGSIFGQLFGCRDILTIHVREAKDTVYRDALMQWVNGGQEVTMNLQLKELVSPSVNPMSASAEEELQNILNELPKRYHNAADLTVAIFMNYGNVRMTRVAEPSKLNIDSLWFFGWSKDNCQELFLIGGKRNEHNFRLFWRHPPG